MSASQPASPRPEPPPFHAADIHRWLAHASKREMDSAGFGIIEVDNDGVVVFYNTFESEFSGMAKEEVVGRAFFTDVAPCSNNPLFFGRFREGLSRETFDTSLRYTLTYRLRPTLVNVRIVRHNGRNWILVTPHTRSDSLGSRLVISRRVHDHREPQA